MTPLTISADKMMFLEDGQPWVLRGFKDFAAFGRLLNDGELAYAALLKDRKAVGANTVEHLGMVDWVPNLRPSNPKFWPGIQTATRLAGEEGLRVLWTVFADAQILMPDLPSQLAHWERFLVTLGATNNTLFMVSNQGDKNGVPDDWRQRFTKPHDFSHLLCARDNPMESANPTLPALDWSGYCSSRDDVKGFVEVGSSMYYVVEGWRDGGIVWPGTHQVSVLTEPMGFDERPSPGRRWADPGKARQLARSLCFKGTGGGFIHTQAGIEGKLLDSTRPVQRACAIEFLGNVPL
jgi:hypothetical protein